MRHVGYFVYRATPVVIGGATGSSAGLIIGATTYGIGAALGVATAGALPVAIVAVTLLGGAGAWVGSQLSGALATRLRTPWCPDICSRSHHRMIAYPYITGSSLASQRSCLLGHSASNATVQFAAVVGVAVVFKIALAGLIATRDGAVPGAEMPTA